MVPQLKFLAIVGFGGLGKTTLAVALYRECGDKFALKVSVLASQKFHLLTVLRSIIRQLNEQQSGASKTDFDGIEEWGLDKLKDKLANQLLQQRYCTIIWA